MADGKLRELTEYCDTALIDAKVEFYDEWIADGEWPAVSPHRRVARLKAVPKRAHA